MPVETTEATTTRVGLVSFVTSLVALAVSIYLTIEHYNSSVTLACPEGGAINCAKVTTSSYSKIGSVPLALLGALFFVGMVVITSPWAWRQRRLDIPRIVGSVLGVIFALYLVWVELFRLDAICLWCTAVHICTVVLLASVLWTTSAIRES